MLCALIRYCFVFVYMFFSFGGRCRRVLFPVSETIRTSLTIKRAGSDWGSDETEIIKRNAYKINKNQLVPRRQFEGHKINLFSANWSKFFDRALIHLCELILFPKQQAKMMSTWMLLNLLIWRRSSWYNKKKIGWFSISVPFVNTNNKGHSKCPLVSHAWVRSIKARPS